MVEYDDTIYALSSGAPPSGVAIIRISGPGVRSGLETLTGRVPPDRRATMSSISDGGGILIDKGLCLFFAGPRSFTGEDCAELHVHGGRAVIVAVLTALSAIEGFRAAQAGEFTRRAFENGRMDLTEVEGLADLIGAETEMQRRLAMENARGGLRPLYDNWSKTLTRCRALVEADLDFSDEEDVPDDVFATILPLLRTMRAEIAAHLDAGRRGETIRDGFRIAIVGAPNAGKSSLMNALACRDVSIVSDEAGTTRDVVTVHLDLGGYCVIVSDTAGIRDASGAVEAEGVRRARQAMEGADLVLYLRDLSDQSAPTFSISEDTETIEIATKCDLHGSISGGRSALSISTVTGEGVEYLLKMVECRAASVAGVTQGALPARLRQREHLVRIVQHLDLALEEMPGPPEIAAENLRRAAEALGRLTGRVGVEDLLGVIFSEFCIGK